MSDLAKKSAQNSTAAPAKKPVEPSTLLRVLPFARPYWKRVSIIALLIGVMALLNQVEPFLSQRVADSLIEGSFPDGIGNQGTWLALLLGIFLAAKLFSSILNRVTWFLTNIFAYQFESYLKNTGFEHLMKLSMSFFNEQSAGDMMSKLDRGVNRIIMIVNNSGMHFLPGLSTAIVSLVVVTYYEWRISLSILLAFVPYVLINRWRFQRNSQLERQEYKLFDKQYSHFWEVLSSMSLIKSFRSEKFEIRKLKQFYDQVLELRKEMERNTNRALGGDLFLESWNWAMYAYIVWLAYSGEISVGTMVLLVGMIKLIREPLWQLNWIFWEVKRAGIGARDFFRIMDVQPEITDPENPVILPEVHGKITFHNVKFVYKNTGPLPNIMLEDEDLPAKDQTQGPQTVFDGVTFTLQAGKTTALVGPSGSGKTTVGALILRYFDPESGHITLDGVDIRDLRQSDLRSEIGLVSQDPFLFAESIAENLRYAKPDASQEEMLAACKAAYALEFIEKLPAGLDTKIGDRGVKLSGGQRQRLSLARTILRNPKIIVLDEATSALDSESEMYIQRALAAILKDRTALVIAHRLSTIQRADKIIVLKDKKVMEEGSHAELLKKNNLYASLFKIQSGHAETLKEWELVA